MFLTMQAIDRSLASALALGIGLLAPEAPGGQPPAASEPEWPRFTLKAEWTVPVNPPRGERFDASGLLWTADGNLLLVSDRGPTLYRVQLRPDRQSADLVPLEDCFTPGQLARWPRPADRPLDCEGIAQDAQGRLYLCEEANRWILRCDPRSNRVERLAIDWSPVTNYFSADPNASFEGLAIGDGRLYVAQERSAPVIISLDLASLKIVDRFVVIPQKPNLFGTHYSDLAWWDHRLFVLCRQQQVVLEVEPRSRTVLAEYDYGALEAQLGYSALNVVGLMEGLAVNGEFFWLAIDNNGLARRHPPNDARPVLLQCPRPKPAGPAASRPGVANPPPPARLAR